MPEAPPTRDHRQREAVFAAATAVTSLSRLFRGWVPGGGQDGRQGGTLGWQPLPHPVPGYTSVDGLPVPVVAVRRHSATAQLQVLRDQPASSESRDGPRDPARHLIPAASFNPHPQRGLSIGGEQFRYNTLANSVSCRVCGKDDLGFGFVSVVIPVDGSEHGLAPDRSLCETCAEGQARVTR